MSHREIARRFDEIVAFAEVEKFLDTPVKRYSSGMYVRLAFAVAAYMEPEILLVDEVLAVGDAVFQRRCIDRMAEMAKSGRTLLFVSHNMELIPRLCQSVILMEQGRVNSRGESKKLINKYIVDIIGSLVDKDLSGRPRSGDGRARFSELSILDEDSRPSSTICSGEDLRCIVEVTSDDAIEDVSLAIVLKTVHGTRLITSWSEEIGYHIDLQPGLQRFECRFENVRFRPGLQVAIELWMSDGDAMDCVEIARVLDVVEGTPTGFSTRADQGPILCNYSWSRC